MAPAALAGGPVFGSVLCLVYNLGLVPALRLNAINRAGRTRSPCSVLTTWTEPGYWPRCQHPRAPSSGGLRAPMTHARG
jgi:hypothetical protein